VEIGESLVKSHSDEAVCPAGRTGIVIALITRLGSSCRLADRARAAEAAALSGPPRPFPDRHPILDGGRAGYRALCGARSPWNSAAIERSAWTSPFSPSILADGGLWRWMSPARCAYARQAHHRQRLLPVAVALLRKSPAASFPGIPRSSGKPPCLMPFRFSECGLFGNALSELCLGALLLASIAAGSPPVRGAAASATRIAGLPRAGSPLGPWKTVCAVGD